MIAYSRKLLIVIAITIFSGAVFAAESSGEAILATESTVVEVTVVTTKGSFTLALTPEKAPKTVANFLTYVDDGFYDNTLFHRVIPGFVVQGGGYEKGMKLRETRSPIVSEADSRLKNTRGTIAMARQRHVDSATSQFFINVANNPRLNYQTAYQPGYTVFGDVVDGMDVIDEIARVPTRIEGQYIDTPIDDVVILSARRRDSAVVQSDTSEEKKERFIAGEHFIVLDSPVGTRDSSKIEVVEMFSYGCPHCYEFEPLIRDWSSKQAGDIDFSFVPAIWNKPMELYARAFLVAHALNVVDEIHQPLFTAIVIEQRSIKDESDLAEFFAVRGVDRDAFTGTFNSMLVDMQVKQIAERVRRYSPAGVPEIVVNGKYRVDRMRAGGQSQMLDVVDFLIEKEREVLREQAIQRGGDH